MRLIKKYDLLASLKILFKMRFVAYNCELRILLHLYSYWIWIHYVVLSIHIHSFHESPELVLLKIPILKKILSFLNVRWEMILDKWFDGGPWKIVPWGYINLMILPWVPSYIMSLWIGCILEGIGHCITLHFLSLLYLVMFHVNC